MTRTEWQGSVQVRSAGEDDLPRLRDLYERSVRKLGTKDYAADALEAWAQFARSPAFREFILGNDTLVAVRGVELLGFSGLDRSGRIASLYVSPDVAGRGMGSMMLEAVLERGREGGLATFHAEASEMSRPLFERFGFAMIERETVERRGVRIHRYLMKRTGAQENPEAVYRAPSPLKPEDHDR